MRIGSQRISLDGVAIGAIDIKTFKHHAFLIILHFSLKEKSQSYTMSHRGKGGKASAKEQPNNIVRHRCEGGPFHSICRYRLECCSFMHEYPTTIGPLPLTQENFKESKDWRCYQGYCEDIRLRLRMDVALSHCTTFQEVQMYFSRRRWMDSYLALRLRWMEIHMFRN